MEAFSQPKFPPFSLCQADVRLASPLAQPETDGMATVTLRGKQRSHKVSISESTLCEIYSPGASVETLKSLLLIHESHILISGESEHRGSDWITESIKEAESWGNEMTKTASQSGSTELPSLQFCCLLFETGFLCVALALLELTL